MVDRLGNWYPDFPGQQPHQDPAYIRAYGMGAPNPQQGNQQAAQQQNMTPTIHADIVQVENTEAIERFPLAAGTTQMFMTKDEKNIVIRTMLANGQHTDDIYDKRPPAPPAPVFNPADYVTKAEFSALIAELTKKEEE